MMLDDSNRLIGFLVASVREGRAHVHRLAAEQNLRGRGIGTQLLARLTEDASHEGLTSITLKVREDNRRALKFYERLGFVEEERERGNRCLHAALVRVRRAAATVKTESQSPG